MSSTANLFSCSGIWPWHWGMCLARDAPGRWHLWLQRGIAVLACPLSYRCGTFPLMVWGSRCKMQQYWVFYFLAMLGEAWVNIWQHYWSIKIPLNLHWGGWAVGPSWICPILPVDWSTSVIGGREVIRGTDSKAKEDMCRWQQFWVMRIDSLEIDFSHPPPWRLLT